MKTLFCPEVPLEKVLRVLGNISFPTALFRVRGERRASERNFLLKSAGRHCALPVAYLSNVTHRLSRCLKKTPASAFRPILHSHISFSCPPRLPFHFPLHCRYCKVKMVCYLFIYENCSEGNVFTRATDLCVCFEGVSEVIFMNMWLGLC